MTSSWIESVHLEVASRMQQQGKRADDTDDDDDAVEEVTSYCGRPGCRAYPHEHMGWGELPN